MSVLRRAEHHIALPLEAPRIPLPEVTAAASHWDSFLWSSEHNAVRIVCRFFCTACRTTATLGSLCELRRELVSLPGALQAVGRVLALIPKLDPKNMEEEAALPGLWVLLETLQVFSVWPSAVGMLHNDKACV